MARLGVAGDNAKATATNLSIRRDQIHKARKVRFVRVETEDKSVSLHARA